MNLLELLKRLGRLPGEIWTAWMTAVAEARIRDSLRVDHALLASVAAGIPSQGSEIPDSTDYICPELTIHAAGFNRQVVSAKAEIALVLDFAGRRQILWKSTIEIQAGSFEFGGVAVKWRGTSLAGHNGPGVFRVLVAERELRAFPVSFLNSADLATQLRVTHLRLNAVLHNGKATPLPVRVVRDQVKTVAPSFRIETPVLAPNTDLSGLVVISQGPRTLVRATFRLNLGKARIDFQVRTTEFPADLDPDVPMMVRVEVMDLVKANRAITVLGAPPITTFDGALTADAADLPTG